MQVFMLECNITMWLLYLVNVEIKRKQKKEHKFEIKLK